MNKETISKIKLILAVTIFGTIGIFRRFIPLPSSVLAMSRGFIGTIFLIALLFLRRQKVYFGVLKKHLLLLILSGAFIGLNWIFLFEAYNYTSIQKATLCYYMAPVFVILASTFFLKEHITIKKVICSVCAVLGIILTTGTDLSMRAEETKGMIFGLLAAVLYASDIIINRIIRDVPAFERTIIQLFVAGITVLPYTIFTEEIHLFSFNAFSVLMIMVVGIVHTGVAYVLYFDAIKDINGQTVAIFSYLDPIVAILLATLIPSLNESPVGIGGVIGTVMVLGGALLGEISFKRK